MLNIAKTESGKEVIAPTVHLNGSGKTSLVKGYQKLREAIWEAQRVMGEVSPHGRDYYVQENEITPSGTPARRAAIEHRARLLKLHEVEEEINAILFNLYDQR